MEKEKRNHEENMKKNLTLKKKMTVIEQVIKVQAKKEIRRVDHREKRLEENLSG